MAKANFPWEIKQGKKTINRFSTKTAALNFIKRVNVGKKPIILKKIK